MPESVRLKAITMYRDPASRKAARLSMLPCLFTVVAGVPASHRDD
ncbi:Unknown protein sequence [Pseudomonas syringae pv. maculicola]|nr:Unknown protein sequence [Pseudomonas syringae pv. maculicola]